MTVNEAKKLKPLFDTSFFVHHDYSLLGECSQILDCSENGGCLEVSVLFDFIFCFVLSLHMLMLKS